jgi:hypothetical protein
MKVKCTKCSKEGYLITKKSKTRDTYYLYYYVKHSKPKTKWCYLGKYDKLPVVYKELLENNSKSTQLVHNKVHNIGLSEKKTNLSSISNYNGAGSGIRTPSPLATSPATFPLFLGLNFNPNPTSE